MDYHFKKEDNEKYNRLILYPTLYKEPIKLRLIEALQNYLGLRY